ncbi:MAG: YceI family protein [Flavobacterium sp.]|nr:YceI family protein [Flavobacterium sp.]
MKHKTLYHLVLIACFAIGVNCTLNAQISFSVERSSDNRITLSGTSTFHDWTMKTKTFSGQAQFNLLPGNDITSITELDLSIPVINLKSNKKALNKNAWKALKASEFKTISYKLISAKIIGQENYRTKITTVGNLSIAGVTKQVNIDIYCMANKGGSITCTAKYRIKMSDYNVDPPYFMQGLMSTSEMVDLDISMRFER